MQLHISFQSDRAYTVSTKDGLFVSRYELLKSKPEARLKALYIGVQSMDMAIAISQEIRLTFPGLRIEIRPAKRCSSSLEVVIRSPKVGMMPAIERFLHTLIASTKPQAKVVPLHPTLKSIAVNPTLPDRIRAKQSVDHRNRITYAGLSME